MPELPEVETIRLGLQTKIVGKKITDLEILVPKIFQGDKEYVVGAKILGIRRRAKIIIIDLDNSFSLIIHLKLTGQLIYSKKESKYTRVIFTFKDSSKLYFNDLRKFGYMKVIKTSEIEKLKVMREFGPEPFTQDFTLVKFKEILAKHKKPVKLILMEQGIIAGVGNIYANEALFEAKISPKRASNEINEKAVEKLYQSLINVLGKGLKYGGASDNDYVDVNGEKGQMQEHFKVYGKKGEKCPNSCGGNIERIVIGGRGTFYCPKCQV